MGERATYIATACDRFHHPESLEAGIIIVVLLVFITQLVPTKTMQEQPSQLLTDRSTMLAERDSEDSNHSSTQLVSPCVGNDDYGTSGRAIPAHQSDDGTIDWKR
nr:hypothetical protein L203_05730 [Cryptococcus depauperatus CBS 7841]